MSKWIEIRWRPLLKVVLLIIFVSLLLLSRQQQSSPAGTQLTDISTIEPLKSQFNAASDKPRLILLLSPT
jgi:hypothetical protein